MDGQSLEFSVSKDVSAKICFLKSFVNMMNILDYRG